MTKETYNRADQIQGLLYDINRMLQHIEALTDEGKQGKHAVDMVFALSARKTELEKEFSEL